MSARILTFFDLKLFFASLANTDFIPLFDPFFYPPFIPNVSSKVKTPKITPITPPKITLLPNFFLFLKQRKIIAQWGKMGLGKSSQNHFDTLGKLVVVHVPHRDYFYHRENPRQASKKFLTKSRQKLF